MHCVDGEKTNMLVVVCVRARARVCVCACDVVPTGSPPITVNVFWRLGPVPRPVFVHTSRWHVVMQRGTVLFAKR